ncbi:MAG: hypothetical protein JJ992_03885, partial [Planctomycetes bacterium]|nr:hypothetical protein [Planctomycetota bacterium]
SNVFGAVRGAELSYFTPALPAEAVLTPDPTFRWVDTDTCSAYTLYLYDQMLNVRYQGSLSGREAPWPPSVVSDQKGGTYYWRLRRSYDGAVTPPRRFVLLPADSIAFVRGELEKLDKELEAMHADEVMRHLIRAIYLEKAIACSMSCGTTTISPRVRVCTAFSTAMPTNCSP